MNYLRAKGTVSTVPQDEKRMTFLTARRPKLVLSIVEGRRRSRSAQALGFGRAVQFFLFSVAAWLKLRPFSK